MNFPGGDFRLSSKKRKRPQVDCDNEIPPAKRVRHSLSLECDSALELVSRMPLQGSTSPRRRQAPTTRVPCRIDSWGSVVPICKWDPDLHKPQKKIELTDAISDSQLEQMLADGVFSLEVDDDEWRTTGIHGQCQRALVPTSNGISDARLEHMLAHGYFG